MSDFLSRITRPDVQQFIVNEELTDVRAMVLRHKEILGLPSSWIATQINGRRKAKDKLPLWYKTPGIVYPPALNLEQCSSEATARYKQLLVKGHSCVDLTAGFGVDSLFLSQVFSENSSVEPDAALLAITQHNLHLLGAKNILFHVKTAEAFIHSSAENYDLLYTDPSRRSHSQKIIRLIDSFPDVVALNATLIKKAQEVIIKASPLLDLKQAYRELPSIDQFIVLAHENECKEVLLVLRQQRENDEPVIHAVNLDKAGIPSSLIFNWTSEKSADVAHGEPRKYIYEPNAAVLKAGAFKYVGQLHGLMKLAPDSHLYTSDKTHQDFPGRAFEVVEIVAVGRELQKRFDQGQANIIVRNFPQTVEQIKKITGLTEGGTEYLICTRSAKPIALIARRLI